MTTKTVRQVCECKHCGNESEMEFSCTLVETSEESEPSSLNPIEKKKVKGTATCSHCGNEADMWIDI